MENPIVAWFNELPANATPIAGGKGASLGDMLRAGLPVPPGFVVCTRAFELFLAVNDGQSAIRRAVENLDVDNEADLMRASDVIQRFIEATSLPMTVVSAMRAAYTQLGYNAPVAVRSSAVSEDSEGASFAGQQETFLNLRGIESVFQHVKACWASFFSPRAMFYRAQKGSLEDVGMAVVVQRMVNADKAGVAFTVDPVRQRHDQMMIEAVYGLGELIVSGLITPDNYLIDRDSGELLQEYVPVQEIALVCNEEGSGTRQVELPEAMGSERVLSTVEITRLREISLQLERLFGKPQDVEWAIEGEKLMLLQSRPITTL